MCVPRPVVHATSICAVENIIANYQCTRAAQLQEGLTPRDIEIELGHGQHEYYTLRRTLCVTAGVHLTISGVHLEGTALSVLSGGSLSCRNVHFISTALSIDSGSPKSPNSPNSPNNESDKAKKSRKRARDEWDEADADMPRRKRRALERNNPPRKRCRPNEGEWDDFIRPAKRQKSVESVGDNAKKRGRDRDNWDHLEAPLAKRNKRVV